MHKIVAFTKRLLEYKYFPIVLFFAAILVMVPALSAGLMMDDFVQRVILLDPSQISPSLQETGHVPDNPGSLSAAIFDLFGFNRDRQHLQKCIDYGVLPWWTYEHIKASLWRPLTAVTHWIDYRLYPDLPVLMHAHSILWFAVLAFAAAVFYRQFIGVTWAAGLAAVLFLIDKSNYAPVAFIANRGFFISIFFAVLTLLSHRRWRTGGSRAAFVSAQIFLALSLLSNEAGVTTFAYLLAYALILEEGSWKQRFASLIPALCVIVVWQVVYHSLGYGGFGGRNLYIDPGREPFGYLGELFQRFPIILASQMSGVSPDLFLAVNDSVRMWLWVFSVIFIGLVVAVMLPLVCRDRIIRFYFLATLFSVLPIATVSPASKNLPFVALGGFGLITSFIYAIFAKSDWMPGLRLWRIPAVTLCSIFLIAHIPAAIAGRMAVPTMSSWLLKFNAMSPAIDVGPPAELEKQDLIVVNAPSPLSMTVMPFYRAYRNEVLPESSRALAPGFRDLEVLRVDDRTLVVKSESGSILLPEQKSPMHLVYVFKALNVFRTEYLPFKVGDEVKLPRLTVKVINVDGRCMPTEVSFHFAAPLEDKSLRWIWFDWTHGVYLPFKVPGLGEKVLIPGPGYISFGEAVRFMLKGLSQARS
jgi:hypothetical protein